MHLSIQPTDKVLDNAEVNKMCSCSCVQGQLTPRGICVWMAVTPAAECPFPSFL